MINTIRFNTHGYHGHVSFRESIGCCGVATIYGLCIDFTRDGYNKKEFLKWLGKEVMVQAEEERFGMLQLTGLTVVRNSSSAYWSGSDSRHRDDINLVDLAKAMRMRKSNTCRNPKTQNDVVLYTKEVKV